MRFLKAVLTIVVLLAAAYAVLALISNPRPEHVYFDQFEEGPLVLAHGGGQRLWPDNTMRAYEGSTALGADVLEIDVHQDADGVFRVIHDATVDRTTDGTGAIADLTAAELQALDAGYRWTVDGPSGNGPDEAFRYRGQGATIPTLDEVLGGFPEIAINIELKQDDAAAGQALCELLRASGDGERVMVASFHSAPMRAFRDACPQVATSATRQEVTLFYVLARARLSAIYSPPFEAMQVPVAQGGLTVVTPHFIEAAHARGLRVQVWTINDAQEMERLLALGVDGLITDRPDRALVQIGRDYDTALVPDFVTP